jgi:hypothetical protein
LEEHSSLSSSFISRHSAFAIAVLLLVVAAAGCDDEKIPHAAPAVDSLARRYLRTLSSGNLDSIRRPLSARGKEVVTSHSLARTLALLEAGPPAALTLIDAEVADSYKPTPAERHRLTYRLLYPNDRSYYYFFELMIEGGDSTITGFRVEPRDASSPDSLAR